jgi:hypothetical protein
MLLAVLLLVSSAFLATPSQAADTVAAAAKLSRTVGLDIVSNTVNADKTVSLTFRWSEKGAKQERTVLVNDRTIVVDNGRLRSFSELTAQDLHAKAVATVGADGVTTILLRFGKNPVPKDQLSPAQLALLASLAPPPSAVSDAALDKRVDGLVTSLKLTDKAQQDRVRMVLAANLRAVRDAHNAGLQLDPSIHKNFIAGLQADLTPLQVETVKDRLTANKLPITFKVYHQILPALTPDDDRVILNQLQQAREECLDVKNADEMSPIFKKHKTEIEKYLNQHGYDWDKAYQLFVDGQKTGSAKSDPSPAPAAK